MIFAGRQADGHTHRQAGSRHVGTPADRQTNRQPGKRTDIQTDRPTGRHTGEQLDRQIGEQADRQTIRRAAGRLASSGRQTSITDRKIGRQAG